MLARLARFSFRKRWVMVFAIWLPLLVGFYSVNQALGENFHTDYTQPDSESKYREATESVRDLAERWMGAAYRHLEALRTEYR